MSRSNPNKMPNRRKPRRRPTNSKGPQRTPLQVAGHHFVDALGSRAIEALKGKLGLNTEVKYADYVGSLTTNTALAQLCNATSTPIPQSLTDNGRQGASVRVTRTHIRFQIQNGAANASPFTAVRVIGVMFDPSVATNWSISDVLESTGDILSDYTHDPTYASRVVYDRTYTLGATSNGADPNQYFDSFSDESQGYHLLWVTSDTAGTYSNSIGNQIVFYALTNGATASNLPTVTVYQRVEFVDN